MKCSSIRRRKLHLLSRIISMKGLKVAGFSEPEPSLWDFDKRCHN